MREQGDCASKATARARRQADGRFLRGNYSNLCQLPGAHINKMFMNRPLLITILLLVASAVDARLASKAHACPFCSAETRTLSEELADCQFAVLAKLIKPAAAAQLGLHDRPQEGVPFGTIDPETGQATFRVETILFAGEDALGPAEGETVEAVFFGEPDFENAYLIRGLGDPLEWTIPLELSPVAVDYVKQLDSLPASGPDRLAHMQKYLQHEDTLLAQDAYDEFARAPYKDVKGLRDRMDREQLLAWIESPTVSPSRRRLYLTMLGVCGTADDIPRIERLLLSDSRRLTPVAEAVGALSLAAGGPLSVALAPESVRLDQRRQKLGLDAMVACYLALRGSEGLDLIDQRFLGDPDVDYSHVYSCLMAIRFLAEESDLVPRDRLLESARRMLDNRDFADQVIPDLARWKDWSVLDQLVSMFKGSQTGEFEKYIRDPIVTYLDVAVEQGGELAKRAEVALAELEPIDPDSFERARKLRSFGVLATARPPTKQATQSPAEQAADALAGNAAGNDAGSGSSDRPTPPLPIDFDSLEPELPAAENKVAKAESSLPPETAMEKASDQSGEDRDRVARNGVARNGVASNGATSNGTTRSEAAEPTAPLAVAVNKGAAAPLLAGANRSPEALAWWLLVGGPLAAFVLFFSMFWMILHGVA